MLVPDRQETKEMVIRAVPASMAQAPIKAYVPGLPEILSQPKEWTTQCDVSMQNPEDRRVHLIFWKSWKTNYHDWPRLPTKEVAGCSEFIVISVVIGYRVLIALLPQG